MAGHLRSTILVILNWSSYIASKNGINKINKIEDLDTFKTPREECQSHYNISRMNLVFSNSWPDINIVILFPTFLILP